MSSASSDPTTQTTTLTNNSSNEQEDDTENGEEATDTFAYKSLLDAEKKIDDHLSSHSSRHSRRLFYREATNDTSWAHLSAAAMYDDDDDDDGFENDVDDNTTNTNNEGNNDKVINHNKTKQPPISRRLRQYNEFLASQTNIEALQRDVAEAEELFYKSQPQDGEEDPATTNTTTTTAEEILSSNDPNNKNNSNSDKEYRPRFKIQTFHQIHYDNMEHHWDQKPFTVDSMRTFFGTIREERMDHLIQSKRSKIAKHGSWDPEGLVLTDLGRPFRCKLYFSVNDEQNLPNHFKVQYLSGVWLSKVYSGEYGQFLDWVEDAIQYVKDKYGGRKVNAHRNFFAYYPSALEQQKSDKESLVVFFIKVSD